MLFWNRTSSRLFFLQTLIFEFFIRSQERSSTSWHTTSSWILTKEIVNRYLMSHNKIYLWRIKILVTNNSWYRNCSFLLPYLNRYCLSECACLDLLYVMAYPCYTDQTYHRTPLVPTFPGRMAVCPIQLAINLINIKWNSWIQMITLFNFLNFFPQCITHVISFFTVECTWKKNGRCMCQLRQCIYISEIFLSYFLMGWLQFWLDIIFPCSLFLKSVRHFL